MTDAPDPLKPGVAVNLFVDGASAAIDFYKKAFGATEITRMPAGDTGKLMHAQIMINGAVILLNDYFPEHGSPVTDHLGLLVHIHNIDARAMWDQAIAAGAEVVMPIKVQFWGDLYGQVKDPFGVTWSIAQQGA